MASDQGNSSSSRTGLSVESKESFDLVIWKLARNIPRDYFDWLHRPRINNIETVPWTQKLKLKFEVAVPKRKLFEGFELCHFGNLRQGLIYAVRQVLRLASGGLCFLGIPCSLLVWISISTSKRGIQGWDLYGDDTLDCVVRSNLHLSRAALLIMICVARSVYWAAEQPGSSKLPQLDYFSTLLSDFRIPTYMTRLSEPHCTVERFANLIHV